MKDWPDAVSGGDVAAAERSIGDAPEDKQRADGHQVHQVTEGSEQRNDGCASTEHTFSSVIESAWDHGPEHAALSTL